MLAGGGGEGDEMARDGWQMQKSAVHDYFRHWGFGDRVSIVGWWVGGVSKCQARSHFPPSLVEHERQDDDDPSRGEREWRVANGQQLERLTRKAFGEEQITSQCTN